MDDRMDVFHSNIAQQVTWQKLKQYRLNNLTKIFIAHGNISCLQVS